jgi:short-subunit dehydrogenase
MPHILITGASSGLGAALARKYAGAGTALTLWGRNAQRLAATAAECQSLKASVDTATFDIGDVAQTMERLHALDERMPLDIAYFNAGIGGQSPPDRVAERPERVDEMAKVNFTSPAVGAAVLAERMAGRRQGQIVLVSSIADSFPLPMAPAYSATKAGLSMYGEALGVRVRPHGVFVTVVSPGFIDTPMNSSETFAKPFLMQAEAAATIIVRKVARRRRRVVLPWPFAVVRAAATILPSPLLRAIIARL